MPPLVYTGLVARYCRHTVRHKAVMLQQVIEEKAILDVPAVFTTLPPSKLTVKANVTSKLALKSNPS